MLHLDENELATLREKLFRENVGLIRVDKEAFRRVFHSIYSTIARIGFVRNDVRAHILQDAESDRLDVILDVVWAPIADLAREQARVSMNHGAWLFAVCALYLILNIVDYLGIIDLSTAFLQTDRMLSREWSVFIAVQGAITGGIHILRGRYELREIERASSKATSESSFSFVKLDRNDLFAMSNPYEAIAGFIVVIMVVIGGLFILGAFNSGMFLFDALSTGGVYLKFFVELFLGLIVVPIVSLVAVLLIGGFAALVPSLHLNISTVAGCHLFRALLFYELALGSLLIAFRLEIGASNFIAFNALSIGLGLFAIWAIRGGARQWAAARVVSIHSADQALRCDKRLPVLYLRSFEIDELSASSIYRPWVWPSLMSLLSIRAWIYQRDMSFEESLCLALGQIGPVVAIGRPGQLLPRLGAFRVFVSDAEWQQKVQELMDQSQLVCLVIGSTSGLMWEFSEMATDLRREKLMLAFTQGPSLVGMWRGFTASIRACGFAGVLPDEVRPDALAVHFTRDWQSILYCGRPTGGNYLAIAENVLAERRRCV